ncbi:hypothetical protein C8T65DRAFT_741632 [Cerioporus squamosus]|nr:hypothetical protein C8T65DRAFT_741711 [Cerioporus squamosus]KAI0701875.1 hypothetical protein C8T65DRAFT_741632 [Cerioporus squamosus]
MEAGATAQDGSQRPRRRIQATRLIDPEIAQNLRPGHVQANPRAQEAALAGSDMDEEEDEMGDLLQQQGIGSDDDSDFVVPGGARARTRRRREPSQTGVSSTVSSQDKSPMPQMSASIHTLPLNNPSARLDALRGANVHSLPSVTGDARGPSATIPSMVNPIAPYPPMPFFFSAPNSGQPPSQTSVLSLSSPSPISSSAPGLTSSLSGSPTSPSPAASTVGKRRRDALLIDNPDEDERNEARARKQAERNAKRRRYKHFAYNGSLQQVIRRTGYILQAIFSTSNPYPSLVEKDRLINQAYEDACNVLGWDASSYTLTDEDMKMFRQEDTNIRSRVRREAAKLVPNVYGLHVNPTPEQREANHKRASWLLEDSRFHYEDLDMKEGRFQHGIIGMVIDLVWFPHPNALGCIYQEHFNPIRHQTIALVLTAIHHVLSVYKEAGRHIRMEFTADAFTKYDEYIVALDQFDRGFMGHVWRRYRRYLFTRGLSHAGTEEEVAAEPVISLAPPEEMDREYARLSALVEKFKDIPDSDPALDDDIVNDESHEPCAHASDSADRTHDFHSDNRRSLPGDTAPQPGSQSAATTIPPIDPLLMNTVMPAESADTLTY